jgi:ADP-ribose pyrophosphatase YjhB (NUDIX family)
MIVFSGVWGKNDEWDFHLTSELPNLPVTSVFGVYVENSKIALTKNERGWELPGGHVNTGEEFHTALAREMKEEVGVLVDTATLFGHIDIRNQSSTLHDETGELYPHNAAILFYTVTGTCTGEHDPKEALGSGLFDLSSPEAKGNRLRQFVDAALGKYNT